MPHFLTRKNRQFLGDTRRFTLDDPTFASVVHTVTTLFGFPPGTHVVLRHADDSGNVCAVTHTDQLLLLSQGIPGAFKVTVEIAAPTYADTPSSSTAAAAAEAHEPKREAPSDGSQPSNGSPPRREPTDLEHIANEFHYHRLIMQTAVEDAFRTFGQSINRALENESEDAFVSKSQRRLNLAKVRKVVTIFEKYNLWDGNCL